MRATEYRAWNEYAKTMYEVDLLHISNKGWQTPELIGDWQYMSLVYQPKVILMQFTGLKDRDGTKIFEDDIIELYEGSRYRVVYQERWGGYELEGLYDRETLGDKVSDWDAKVIGNIHQNKELLKV